MSIVLYDLRGADDRRFSPYCWRSRLALAHKGLDTETVPILFTDKDRIAFSGQGKVPIIVDGDVIVSDSWDIACYLEDTYPDRPSLFGGAEGRGVSHFVNQWSDRMLNPVLLRMIIVDVFHHIEPIDRDYFRASREDRFGMPLEEAQADRETRLAEFRANLAPLRATVEAQPFLCGAAPAYADYIVFSVFQWGRCMSDLALLEMDDPLVAWRTRMLGLFDGLAGKATGYPC